MVARDGIELQGGIEKTQVVDFAFGQKGQKAYFAGSAVQNWYKNSFPIEPLFQRQHENTRRQSDAATRLAFERLMARIEFATMNAARANSRIPATTRLAFFLVDVQAPTEPQKHHRCRGEL